MKQKRNIFWFVEPLNSHTSKIMAQYLSSLGDLIEHTGLKDKEEKNHFAYEVPDYAVITRFLKDKREFNLKFDVYYRQKNYGPINLWQFT